MKMTYFVDALFKMRTSNIKLNYAIPKLQILRKGVEAKEEEWGEESG